MIDVLFIALMQAAAGDPAPVTQSVDPPAATSDAGATTPTTPAASPTTETAQPAPTTPQDQRTVRRCRSEVSTGSIMAHRRCTSRAEDQANSEAAQRGLDAMRRTTMRAPGQ